MEVVGLAMLCSHSLALQTAQQVHTPFPFCMDLATGCRAVSCQFCMDLRVLLAKLGPLLSVRFTALYGSTEAPVMKMLEHSQSEGVPHMGPFFFSSHFVCAFVPFCIGLSPALQFPSFFLPILYGTLAPFCMDLLFLFPSQFLSIL